MINEQVARIINSNVCQTIASTVSKNQEELHELQLLFADRSQQILTLHQRIAQQMNFLQQVVESNKKAKKHCQSLEESFREFSQTYKSFAADFRCSFEKCKNDILGMVMLIPSSLSTVTQKHREVYEKEMQSLRDQIINLQQELSQQSNRAAQLSRINSELKKEELSKIFMRRSSKRSLPITDNTRQMTDNDVSLKTLQQNQDNTQNTFTQPFDQTTIVREMSRKKSLTICPSVPAITTNSAFDFDKLKEVGYEGKRIGGKKVGKGVAIYQGRYSFEGDFVNDVRQGYGILKHDGQLVYVGSWQNNLFHGKGTIFTFPNVLKYRGWEKYSGFFKQGNIEGFGSLYLTNGEQFLASFKNGNVVNKGVLYKDKDIHYGDYKNQTFTPTFYF